MRDWLLRLLCPLHGQPDRVGPTACHWCGRGRYAHKRRTDR